MKKRSVIAKLLSAALVFNVLVGAFYISGKWVSGTVKAAGLTQSDQEIYVSLLHNHSRDECYNTVWVPCGGSWCTNWEHSYGGTVSYCENNHSTKVVNGVVLKDIHNEFTSGAKSGTHSGEYHATCTCGLTSVGTIKVQKEEVGDKVRLKAYVEDTEGVMSDCSISWNQAGAYQEGDYTVVDIDHNGRYVAEVSWFDNKSGVSENAAITYSDTSFPIYMDFYDEDSLIETRVISYGEILPDAPQKLKEGYIFMGYADKGTMIYNDNLEPVPGSNTQWEQKRVAIKAQYKAKEYDLYYGEDEDGDGYGDLSVHVVYGEPYPELEGIEADSSIAGYSIDNHLVYDNKGKPLADAWKWDVDTRTGLDKRDIPSKSGGDSSNQEEEPVLIEDDVPIVSYDIISQNEVSDNIVSLEQQVNLEQINDSPVPRSRTANEGDDTPVKTNIYRHESHDPSKVFKGDLIKEENATNKENTAGQKQEIQMPRDAENDTDSSSKIKDIIVTAVKVTLALTGIGLVIYGLVFLWFVRNKSAYVYTYVKDSHRKMIGRTLLFDYGTGLKCRISQKLIDQSPSGLYEIVFTEEFVRKHKNAQIMITVGGIRTGRKVVDVLKPLISVEGR